MSITFYVRLKLVSRTSSCLQQLLLQKQWGLSDVHHILKTPRQVWRINTSKKEEIMSTCLTCSTISFTIKKYRAYLFSIAVTVVWALLFDLTTGVSKNTFKPRRGLKVSQTMQALITLCTRLVIINHFVNASSASN